MSGMKVFIGVGARVVTTKVWRGLARGTVLSVDDIRNVGGLQFITLRGERLHEILPRDLNDAFMVAL